MFSSHEKLKNLILHETFPDLNPIVLNRRLNQALEKRNEIPTINGKLTSQQPKISDNCNIHNSRIMSVSYGEAEMPSVIRGINSKNLNSSLLSLNTLYDALQNPEKMCISLKLNTIEKLEECLEWFQNFVEEPSDVDIGLILIFKNYKLISQNIDGASLILNESKLIEKLLNILKFQKSDICQNILKIFCEMTSHPTIALIMVSSDFVYQLRNITSFSECIEEIPEFYDLNKNLFERSPQSGLDLGYFHYLLTKLNKTNPLLKNILQLLAVIVSTPAASKMADTVNVIPKLIEIIKYKKLSNQTLQYAVMALHNVTLSTRARWQCREMNEITLVLIQLAHSKNASNLQLACLQVLRQMTEMPSIKHFVWKTCKDLIKTIPCESEEVEIKRNLLIAWLRSKPYPCCETQKVEKVLLEDCKKEPKKNEFLYKIAKKENIPEEMENNFENE